MRATTTPKRRDESGAVVIEFAVVFIVFVLLLWGLVTYGVVFAVQQSLEHAADEATRVGFGQTDPAIVEQAAKDVITDQLSWLGEAGAFDPATGDSVQVAPCPYTVNGETPDCLAVVVTFDWANDALIPALFDVGIPDVLSATATVTTG